MKRKSILIVGYGIVGKNIYDEFKRNNYFEIGIYDIEVVKCHYDVNKKYDLAFICVPTPKNKDGSCNYSFVEEAIKHTKAELYCIKSTIPPGKTEDLNKFKKCIFSPEYAGETINANGFRYNFAILGGKLEYTNYVAEFFKRNYTGNFKIIQTDSRTAELCKYMENSFIAAKVTFCNEFHRLAKRIGVDYNELRELFLLDPRVSRSHTYVFEDQPYYDSKCLNKDIPGIIKFAEDNNFFMDLMNHICKLNMSWKKGYTKS